MKIVFIVESFSTSAVCSSQILPSLKKEWMRVATSAEQQTSVCICGEFDFVLGQPQSADLGKGVD